MISSAASCSLASPEPVQEASTMTGTSGQAVLAKTAFEMTQMFDTKPTSSM